MATVADRQYFTATLADGTDVNGWRENGITFLDNYPKPGAWLALSADGIRLPLIEHNPLYGVTINWEAGRG